MEIPQGSLLLDLEEVWDAPNKDYSASPNLANLSHLFRTDPAKFMAMLQKEQKDYREACLEAIRIQAKMTESTSGNTMASLPDPGTQAALDLIAELKAKIKERMAANKAKEQGED
jgi:hypothetical protein